MKLTWIVAAALIAGLGVIAADPALARAKKAKVVCVDRPYQFSWSAIWPGHPAPQPNGCAPPVYNNGKYVGQDPDPNIRLQLLRDPGTGYSAVGN